MEHRPPTNTVLTHPTDIDIELLKQRHLDKTCGEGPPPNAVMKRFTDIDMQILMNMEVEEDIDPRVRRNVKACFKTRWNWPGEGARFLKFLQWKDNGAPATDDVLSDIGFAKYLEWKKAKYLEKYPIQRARQLLCKLVAEGTEWSPDLTDVNWIQEEDEGRIRGSFHKRFKHLPDVDLHRLEDDVNYIPQGMVAMKKFVTDTMQRETEALQKKKKESNRLIRLAVEADHSVKVEPMSKMMPLINEISSLLGKTGTKLAHDGTSTYAEPTKTGLIDIANAIRPLLGDPAQHVLLDCGSGVGTTLWTLCNALGIKGIGIEYSPNRVGTGAAYTSILLKRRASDPDLQYHVANGHGNILDLAYMPDCVTIAYQYDEAFPPDLMDKLMALYTQAQPTLRFIVASKAYKQRPCVAFYEKWGLYPLLPPILCKMICSGESSSFTIYGRRCCDYSDLRNKVAAPPTLSVDKLPSALSGVGAGDLEMTKVFYERAKAVMDGNLHTVRDYYDELQSSMFALTTSMRKGRTQKVGVRSDQECLGPSTLQHCGALECSACKTAFAHVDERTLYADHTPWLPGQLGIFTDAELDRDKFVIRYEGRKVTMGSTGKYVLQLPSGNRVDARGFKLHGLINHCCRPNCTFQKWSDSDGVEHVSIRTLLAIAAKEELTTDYGPDRESFICRCHVCMPCTKSILLLGMTGLSTTYMQRTFRPEFPTLNSLFRAMLQRSSQVQVCQHERDSIRLCTLRALGWRAFSVSLEDEGCKEFASSHLQHDWNRNSLVKALREMKVNFDTIQLDYCWMPQGYIADRLPRSFFAVQLTKLAEFLVVGGSILFPAQMTIFEHLAATRIKWSPFYKPHFLDTTTREKVCPLLSVITTLQKEWSADEVDLALSKNGNTNTENNTTIRKATFLQHATVETKAWVEPLLNSRTNDRICMIRLERIPDQRKRDNRKCAKNPKAKIRKTD